MSAKPKFEVNKDFQHAMDAYIEGGMFGRSPDLEYDLVPLPDQDKAFLKSGFTLGVYPQRDPITGEIIERT